MDFTIRTIETEDIERVDSLQMEYMRVHPNVDYTPSDMYLSSTFGNGKNVFCAFNPDKGLLGYIWAVPVFAGMPDVPHTVWAHFRIWPEITETDELRSALFRHALDRAREIVSSAPGHKTQLTFQLYSSEVENKSFLESIGCIHFKSGYRMGCDLSEEPVIPPISDKIEVRESRLESAEEVTAYVNARNKVFAEFPTTVDSMQNFINSSLFEKGVAIMAFVNGEIIGSVSAYWDENENRTLSKSEAFTEDIFVMERWRRQGIASHLIARGLAYLKEYGIGKAQLDVDADNSNAISVYKRLGYIIGDEARLYALTL